MKIVFATKNKGKLKEMKDILKELNLELVDMEEAGVNDDIEEDGYTFEENAFKKARVVFEKTKLPVIADDSGLCINTLSGEPGVKTARWAGENATGEDLIIYTIQKLEGKKDRSAYFKTAAVFIDKAGKSKTFTGKIEGAIPEKPSGKLNPKLPYDVIFIPEGVNKTFAEISKGEKNKMSHRGQAFEKIKKYLKRLNKEI